jgi:ubiquinone/menaquinone biosynthesis C-methylase UbiE
MRNHEIAPCLVDSPIAYEANRLIESAGALGYNRLAAVMRAWVVVYLANCFEEIARSDDEPIEPFNDRLRHAASFLQAARETGIAGLAIDGSGREDAAVESFTASHYGNLFAPFSPASYFEEAVSLLRTRLERNDVALDRIQNRSALDAGCGGGRYAAAWRLLGAKPVVGVDLSEQNIGTATERAREAKLDDIEYRVGNVLELPFHDASFDIVYSNGVLHHTKDWMRGVDEMMRVLKPGGLGWLYLIESPGGLFWDNIEIQRVILKDDDPADARLALQVLGLPANRIFYILDHSMVPINLRLTPEQIEAALRNSGATNIRRLTRGADFDRIEQIYKQSPYASALYGVGENRYIFSK